MTFSATRIPVLRQYRTPKICAAVATLASAAISASAVAAPNYGMPPGNAAFPEPTGFESFQLTAPYNTDNPFSPAELEIIDNGFAIFTTETFDGNGRTCSSCHIPSKNYNIALEDFERLSAAEQQLILGGSNPHLENPEAITEKVLFNINQSAGPGTEGDISEPLGPFRSSMNIGGIGFAVLNNHVCIHGETSPGGTECPEGRGGPPRNFAVDDGIRDMMIGWSGEGPLAEAFPWWDGALMQYADCDGLIEWFSTDASTLRDLDLALAGFSLAAVKTHFTRSQNREPGVDFRCPTQQELLDMSLFQKWLGRRFELDITQLQFSAPEAQHGRNLFSSRLASCVACHVNAGASDTQGRVKSFSVPFLTLSGEPDPFDNDFEDEPLFLIGTNKTSRNGSQFLEDDLQAGFSSFTFPLDRGDHEMRSNPRQGGFNVQSIIEAVRNKQFFHNNGVTRTIEDAIEFYFTPHFHCPQVRYDEEIEVDGEDVPVVGPEVPECAGIPDSQGGAAVGGDFRAEHRTVSVDYAGETYTVDVEWEFSPSEVRAMLGGDAGIAAMGLFLRSLATVYAIADCERFIDEIDDRIDLGLSVELPSTHCQFALADVKNILGNAQVHPNPYSRLIARLNAVNGQLHGLMTKLAAAGKNGKPAKIGKVQAEVRTGLEQLRADLLTLRRAIAVTPELSDPM